jgi:hypothetical protein
MPFASAPRNLPAGQGYPGRKIVKVLSTGSAPITKSVAELPIYFSSLFQQTAANLLSMRPSHIMDQDIINLETMLNDAYLYANQCEWSMDIQNAILSGLAQATELSDLVQKNPGQPRNKHFYREIKKIVNFLQITAVFLIDESGTLDMQK